MSTHPLWPDFIDMQGFAERLRLLRTARGLTQTRLAELLGMPARSYNRWERGTHAPHLELLVKLADLLQVSLDELVGRTAARLERTIRNHELHRLVQKADDLPDGDQQALIAVLDGLVRKTEMAKVMGQRPTNQRAKKVAVRQ